MMSRVKPIAEGFHEDVGNMLNEFLERCTTEFSEFAEIWKKYYFSLIFMGRPDHTELSEFTNEIFRLTCQFLSSPSFYQQVGAVYTLYALFQNQILTPTIKIRIERDHLQIIKALFMEAEMKKYKTLHYVIEYLLKNAFIYVGQQTLIGPVMGSLHMKKVSKNAEEVSKLLTYYKNDVMQYSVNNNLANLRDLHLEYYKEKMSLKKNVSDVKIPVHLNAAHEMYDKFIGELNDIVCPTNKKEESLGSRRAKLKAQSFLRKAEGRFGQVETSESDTERDDCSDLIKKRQSRREKRTPKHERRVGRPRKNPIKIESSPKKNSDNEDIDISHLLSQQEDFYLPTFDDENKKTRLKREHYYKDSPKREKNDSSDPDNV